MVDLRGRGLTLRAIRAELLKQGEAVSLSRSIDRAVKAVRAAA
jgi:hypothetical protein